MDLYKNIEIINLYEEDISRNKDVISKRSKKCIIIFNKQINNC